MGTDYATSYTHSAIRWHPPSYDIRVEIVPIPKISHPDDAVVKVKYAALCGSDLHIYRGHGGVSQVHTCGHEFIGEIVALGSNFRENVSNRPALYSSLRVGDKVISPFTTNCGECQVCRLGFTARCPEGILLGSPRLEGGQAQYIRIPKAGGTLFNLNDSSSWSSSLAPEAKAQALLGLSDSSLLLLADILPTGLFAAVQALSHPKLQPFLTGRPWPLCLTPGVETNHPALILEERKLTLAIIGLGPVGICATVALLDALAARGIPYNIVAIDPLASRREKVLAVYNAIDDGGKGQGQFIVQDIEGSKKTVKEWTGSLGCNAVLEVVGNTSALTLAYDLVRSFGVITSVGVHGDYPVPFQGQQFYNKNVSLDFGRCPARAMFPPAFDLLVRRQDVFGTVGEPASLIDRIADFTQAPELYRAFDKGDVGKIVFDPWK